MSIPLDDALKILACICIEEEAKEYAKEFKTAKLADIDEEHHIFATDKHFFDFILEGNLFKLVDISDVIYWLEDT